MRIAVLCIFLLPYVASAQNKEVRCWDGTFAYNSLRISQVSDGFETSMQGNTLGTISLDGFAMGAWNQSPALYAKFLNSECVGAIGEKLRCAAIAINFDEPHIYFERSIDDLGNMVDVIVPVAAQRLEFNFDTTNGAEFKITENSTQTAQIASVHPNSIEPLDCVPADNGSNLATFPDRLRTYLSQHH